MIRHGDTRGILIYSKQSSTAVLFVSLSQGEFRCRRIVQFVQRDDLMWLCKYYTGNLANVPFASGELQLGNPHFTKTSDVVPFVSDERTFFLVMNPSSNTT